MPAKRPRKRPISSSASAKSGSATISHKVAQATISSYHTLLKQRSALNRQLSKASGSAENDIQARLDKINGQLESLGGIEAYQHASVLGQSSQRGGDTSRVLINWLSELGSKPSGSGTSKPTKLKMLEIGALTPDNYDSCSSWIENSPMDLNSRHPDILEQDFLQRPVPETEEERFDIVSCSLVLNFVGDPTDRGRMLKLCHAQLRSRPSSLLFITLPLPCVANSRYMTHDHFKRLVESIGFTLVKEQWREGGKVACWLWRRREEGSVPAEFGSKKLLNDGKKRNNFTILVGESR
ncbi:25S rRNA (adenine2142-N1)-methyltransferase [Vanrija albida]|uniref:25S rRNA adenine-N(1) methyltransferase n=1 Tax=Vanrija albida TaxID=181172 RepID=A0ABR3PUD8_9TREE